MLRKIMQCNQINTQAIYVILAVMWTSFIIVSSLMPISVSSERILWAHIDKLVHFIFYLLATLLWLRAGFGARRVLLSLFVLGWAIEMLQHISGWRSGDLYDGLANMLGVLIAYGLFKMMR